MNKYMISFNYFDEKKLHPDQINDKKITACYYTDLAMIYKDSIYDTLVEISNYLLKYHCGVSCFYEKRRHTSAFSSTDIIAFDFDKNTVSSKDMHNYFKKFAHIIVASKSYTESFEKFHLYLFLDETIEDKEKHTYIMNELTSKVSILKNNLDNSCTDVTRYFAKHKKVLYINDGILLPTVKILENFTDNQIRKTTKSNIRNLSNVINLSIKDEDKQKVIYDEMLKLPDIVKGQESDNTMWICACKLVKLHADDNDWNRFCSFKVFGDIKQSELDHKWNDALKKVSYRYNDGYFINRLKELNK